ncbi:MAG TPA: hypothetical protein VH141_08175 [Pseudonocardia sp.]|jgi:hypothetical protein|nr:hypothetical protein [Pseudonocardia sp.]
MSVPRQPSISPSMSPMVSPSVSPRPGVPGADLQVSRENVLEVRSVLLGEAERLLDSIRSANSRRGWVGPCGGDPVSAEASAAFDARIRIVLQRCQRYALQLREAGTALEEIARDYGYTDAQLAASLTSRDPGSAR